MKYQLRGNWPVGQFCIPVGTVIDTNGSDQWSTLVKNLRPPLNAMPLNRLTWEWMQRLYPGEKHRIVTPAGAKYRNDPERKLFNETWQVEMKEERKANQSKIVHPKFQAEELKIKAEREQRAWELQAKRERP